VNGNDLDTWDPAVQEPILQRGTDFKFNPIADIMEKFYTQGQADLSLTPDTVKPVLPPLQRRPAS